MVVDGERNVSATGMKRTALVTGSSAGIGEVYAGRVAKHSQPAGV